MRGHRGAWRRIAIAVAAATGMLVAATSAGAATLTVTMSGDEWSDPGAGAGCSVREAIEAANTDGNFAGCNFGADDDADTIILSPDTTYGRSPGLTGIDEDNQVGDFDVRDESLTIRAGAGPNAALQGTAATSGDRVIDIAGATPITVSIDGVDLINGNTTGPGGGMRTGTNGIGGTVNLSNLAVFGNNAVVFGGGIEMVSGTLNLTNVTIGGNGAGGNGGGGLDTNAGTANLNSVTISQNATNAGNGGGIDRFGTSVVQLFNTVVAGNQDVGDGAAPDCHSWSASGPISQGFNLIGDTTGCSYTAGTGDVTNPATPGLAPISTSNGTRVFALQPGSPAIDAGATSGVPATDQRALARPQGARCDMGAFELDAANDSPSCAGPASSPPPPPVQPKKKKCKKKHKKRAALSKKKCKKRKH